MSFCKNDIIEINIDILSSAGCLNIENFKWVKYQEETLCLKNFIDFQKNEFNLLSDFDSCRVCELELKKKSWQSSERIPSGSIINKIKYLFEPSFILQNSLWDDVGYELYKFYLLAASKGKLCIY